MAYWYAAAEAIVSANGCFNEYGDPIICYGYSKISDDSNSK